MKLAIIDIGSNSVRLLLATYENNIWHYEPKQLWTTRLGQRNSDGTLRTESMEASYQAFTEIKKLADQYGVECCFGFATSAVREASNGLEFMDRISEHCPMEWRILTGDEEAIYGFNGALGDQLNDGRHYTTIDIGGGSTELALGNKDGVYWSRSYPVGAVRLQSMSDEGPQRVWEETRFLWDPMMIQGEFGEFIGIGGTLTTLAAIDLGLENYDGTKVQGHKLSRETVEGIILNLRYMSRDERLQVKGLPAGRADIIVAGAEILTSFMDAYEVPHVFVSDQDGMEAMARECESTHSKS